MEFCGANGLHDLRQALLSRELHERIIDGSKSAWGNGSVACSRVTQSLVLTCFTQSSTTLLLALHDPVFHDPAARQSRLPVSSPAEATVEPRACVKYEKLHG